MKNTVLWGALFTIISSQGLAEGTTVNPTAQQQPTVTTVQPVTTPASSINPINTQPQAATAETAVNCAYKISPQIKTVEKSLVKSWAEKATLQAFTLAPSSLDRQIADLHACFTDQGWVGFNNAMQKSGNIDAIKSQNLTVTSKVDDLTQLTEIKENQWKITIPLQVVYQNDKEKVTQTLSIDLMVGRKSNGDLGIMQIIATPRVTAQGNNQTNAAAPQSDAYDSQNQTSMIETQNNNLMTQ